MEEMKIKVNVDAEEAIKQLEKVKSLVTEIKAVTKDVNVNLSITNEADIELFRKDTENFKPEVSS